MFTAPIGSAGRLVSSGQTFTTRVPHGTTCEDMKDTRDLPEWTVWSKPLSSAARKVALLVLNTRQDKPANVTVSLADIGVRSGAGGDGEVKQTDVWSGEVTKLQQNTTCVHVSLPPGGHHWVILESGASGDLPTVTMHSRLP